ncbi:ZapG family protein [Shewanella surugensis]|uniref:YhcB family protein n=1 Tax=Shewanella surugensis TaxID=212020 RepID=A0ABT0LFW7_9GAMM|nr:DUF1043 family protein [Shewanella surugensis]MCL1126237.1 YhcB family protein [Shewanella surugensis]
MQWALTLSGFIFGLLLGFAGKTFLIRNRHSRQNDDALTQTKIEFSQYKQEVTDTLDEQHKQLSSLTEQLSDMNQKWNEASQILTPNSDKLLSTLVKNDSAVDTTS